MNKFYLVVPAILLVGFFPLYRAASAKMTAAEEAKHEQAAIAAKSEEARRRELDLKAEADARTRQEERDAQERERDAKKKADYADAMRRLTEERETYAAEAAKFTAEVATLEKQLADLRAQKDAAAREAFELVRQVELPKIERRNAELEVQRTYAMVASRVAASSLANPPAAAR
jgi:chromosome segregation ATPase